MRNLFFPRSLGERYPTAAVVAEHLDKIAQLVVSYTKVNNVVFSVGRLTLRSMVGNLAFAETDVIVNAANWKLRMRKGIASAIRHEGGESIQTEALSHAPAAIGDVV